MPMNQTDKYISYLEAEIQYLKKLLDDNGISYDYEAHLRALQSDVGDIIFPELGPEHANLLYSYFKGRHDGSIRAYSNYFKTTAQILDLTVKPTACPFLSENLQLTLCHYPMVTWNKKPHGSIMLHGHCHGKLDEHNRLSNDLRFDVGIDGELAKRAGGFIPLELIYEAAMEKTGGVPFHQYAKQNYRSEVR